MANQTISEIDQLKAAIARARRGFVSLAANGTTDDYTLFTQAKRELTKLEKALNQVSELPTQRDRDIAEKMINGKIPFFTDGRAYFFAPPESGKPYISREKQDNLPHSLSLTPQKPVINSPRRVWPRAY